MGLFGGMIPRPFVPRGLAASVEKARLILMTDADKAAGSMVPGGAGTFEYKGLGTKNLVSVRGRTVARVSPVDWPKAAAYYAAPNQYTARYELPVQWDSTFDASKGYTFIEVHPISYDAAAAYNPGLNIQGNIIAYPDGWTGANAIQAPLKLGMFTETFGGYVSSVRLPGANAGREGDRQWDDTYSSVHPSAGPGYPSYFMAYAICFAPAARTYGYMLCENPAGGVTVFTSPLDNPRTSALPVPSGNLLLGFPLRNNSTAINTCPENINRAVTALWDRPLTAEEVRKFFDAVVKGATI